MTSLGLFPSRAKAEPNHLKWNDASKVATARESLMWHVPAFSLALLGLTINVFRRKTRISNVYTAFMFTEAWIIADTFDMAYGSKIERIREGTMLVLNEKILND